MTRTRRILAWVMVLLLILLALPPSVAGLLLTEGGSRWVLERVPGLSLDGYQGALLGRWQADGLRWQDEQLQVELTALDMRLDAGCLWRGMLCLEHLRMERIALELADNEEAPAEPATDVELPDLHLPLSARIGELNIGALYLNSEPLLQGLDLTASSDGSELLLDNLSLAYGGHQAALNGRLQMNGRWPLTLVLDVTSELAELGPQQARLELGGALRDTLELDGHLQGVLNGRLNGWAQPLLAALPARLELVLDTLELAPVLPSGMAVNSLTLSAEGSLEQGFAWQLASSLQAQQEAFALSAHGQADTGAAEIRSLRLEHAQQGHVELQARAGWADALTASATLGVEAFPWHYLAGMDQAPVQVSRADLVLDYSGEAYTGTLQGTFQGPAGEFAIDSHLQGDAGKVQVEPLQVTAGGGRIHGALSAGWEEALSWQAALDIEALNPAYWMAELPGRLDGQLRSTGRLLDATPDLTADLQLGGQLREQPFKAVVHASGQGGHWAVPELDVTLGDNRVHGQAGLTEQLSANLTLTIAKAEQLYPDLSGRLQGQLELAGTLQQPDAKLRLDGHQLAFQDQRLRDLQLTALLRQGRSGELNVQARGLASGEQLFGQLQLKADGELQQHRLQASLQGPLANADLRLAGRLQADSLHWQGQLEQLRLAVESQVWQLERPLDIDYAHERHARLGTHCLLGAGGRLCAAGEQQLLPQLQLDYRLQAFGLASLQPWLPPDLALDGQLAGELRIRESKTGLQGRIGLDAGQGTLRLGPEADQLFAWQTLEADVNLLSEQVDARIRLQGAEQGRLLVETRIDPRPADKPLKGRFTLSDLDLGALHGFVDDIEHLQGRIEGQGEIAGTLLQPVINGEILLSGGHVGGGALPITLEQLGLSVRIAGQQAQLQGDWRSGEDGRGELSGTVHWTDALVARFGLQGRDLPVFVQPYADLQVTPELEISYDTDGLAVIGSIAVPRGSINVPELPPDSVSVSADTVVVGREATAAGPDVHMNIVVDVGSERLKFSGFGLTSDVQGRLLVADNLSGRGVLELNNGRFRSYGQKLDLRRARLVFSGPLTQPYIDIEAVRVTGNVTAGIRINGLAEQPQAQIFSEPPMEQEQAMSWLLLGRPLGSSEDGNLMAEAAIGLGLMGALPVTQKLAGRLGIEDFQLESEGSGDQTSVVASGQITERLSLRYGVGIFEPGNTLGLRYKLTRRLYLDAASGLANSLDLFYRRSF